MKDVVCRSFCILVALAAIAGPLCAQVAPERPSDLMEKSFRPADLEGQDFFQEVGRLPLKASNEARQRLADLKINAATARIDARSGRFETLMPAEPMIPGKGVGNELSWSDFEKAATPRDRGLEQAAWQAFHAYLVANQGALGIDPTELGDPKLTSYDGGDLINIYVPRLFDGIEVRGSYIGGVIGHGNLILFGTHKWGDRGASSGAPQLGRDEAVAIAEDYLSPLEVSGDWGKPNQVYLVRYNGNAPETSRGYGYDLVWSVKKNLVGDRGNWEVLVDAFSGEILGFEDTNEYAEIRQGVYPTTNDGIAPDGVEQAGWPSPYASTSLGTTDTGGNVAGSGSITATLSGTYVNMADQCGADSLTQNDNVDWGTSGGTDCTTPGFGGAGNTHASRTGFYELNKLKEMARGQLPSNTWLQGTLTSNMNINSTCNAFWNGSTVNFYRSGGGCANTGELAGVFDHEWGHGMDANDAAPGIASPSGEGIADVYAALRLNTSCIGRNFRPGVQCGGYGDPCINCTGVRDIDYLKHVSGTPHDFTWRNANCGGGVHCSGYVYSEAVWSLWKRKLQSAPYNYDNNTAHEISTRLTYIGAGNTGTWYSGSPPNGGCGAGSGYLNYLAADDDNGNINDGTPHMGAIFAAFDDQEIACNTPTVQDSGCAGVATSAPSVTASPSDKAIGLSWTSVSGASTYAVFRTEGVFACDFGKVLLGETTGTSWNDSGLQNGRTYSYVVIPKTGASCFGPASSCTSAAPAAGPGLTINTGSASTMISGGDGDAYLDNCEDATTTFTVTNSGLGSLTNVRIVSATPSNPGVTVNTSFPAAIAPSTLSEGAMGTGSISYTAGGLSPGEVLTIQVEVTADETASSQLADLTIGTTETDLTFTPSTTYSFESDAEGWTTVQGTFNRSSAGGGALGSTWYEQSSANLDNQCDQIQSPVMVFSATTTLSLYNNYDIEPQYTNGIWYDRANVGTVVGGSRSLVTPDGGRPYNASGAQGTCGTSGQGGWADAATTWGSSSFSAGALGSAGLAGQEVQLDIRYGTDASLNGYGFRFDEVTVTDVYFQGADTQSDSCMAPTCTVDADCDDNDVCNGLETCVGGTCQAGTPLVCDDGAFCNGAETCDPILGCQAGTPPNCDDGVGCTDDSCNEGTDQCDNVANDANCDDGAFCNGAETCDPVNDCQPGTDPCPIFCDEVVDVCYECNVDADCDDGLFCNGAETCNAGSCQAGTPPCTGGDTCDEVGDVCVPPPVCFPKGASCTLDSDCCSNKCRGKAGSKSCK